MNSHPLCNNLELKGTLYGVWCMVGGKPYTINHTPYTILKPDSFRIKTVQAGRVVIN